MTLYDHKWKDETDYKEEKISVPGIDNIYIRYVPQQQPSAAVDTASPVDSSKIAAAAPAEKTKPETRAVNKPGKKRSKFKKFIIIYWIIAIIIVAFFIFRLIVWIKHKMLMRSIEREEIL